MSRKHSREKAFQVLFQIDINKDAKHEDLFRVLDEDLSIFSTQIIKGVMEYKQELDTLIEQNLEHWSINRIGAVEKTLLRIAAYEMRYVDDTPDKVAVNEAVELAKRFHDEQSGKFINGVLSKIMSS
ncbi:transcription antitermination factor NusB [Alkalibacillus haloalkaliphilus]|uniref:transcription antitermination factor NusB n=1 Tax=Alkalibacillus haloalkaliphilus TaxID=94136 RepID=UPI00293661C9|nr:transcription antitermination factor NusB [Alkalibacillus haloalkaliphilus]MDV2580948.1 transcription antitermination factor NusB [Alkalibacillus haloalkaliphilus]